MEKGEDVLKKILFSLLMLLGMFLIGCETEDDLSSVRVDIQVLREVVYHDAVAVRNSAALYCAANTCTSDQELLYSELQEYFTGVDMTIYDLNSTNNVIAVRDGDRWFVTLERVGTGDYEWPFNYDPNEHTLTDALVDNN